jgi:signal transduction histidine kinase
MAVLSVIIVDDEPGMRLGAERTLKDFNLSLPGFDEKVSFETRIAANGGEALRLLDEKTPDILILDYKLPDIHGLEILSQVRKERKSLLAIMITAYASLEVAINATKNGAFDFLAKPFTPEELRNTVRKAAEHICLERKAKKLEEEKRQVRFQFVSVLAHELKSPLVAVENYLRIMKDRISGDDMSSYDEMIGRSILRIGGMRDLIANLLDLTRIESGQKTRSFSEVGLAGLASEVMEGVREAASEKKVAITLDCSADPVIRADKGELEILLSNLLTNGVKYNREGGSVALSIRGEKGSIVISCADTGIGMTDMETAGLFKEFYRVRNDMTRNIVGSGLGLSIVKKIADLYGGGVDVSSVPGKGSVFTVRLRRQ